MPCPGRRVSEQFERSDREDRKGKRHQLANSPRRLLTLGRRSTHRVANHVPGDQNHGKPNHRSSDQLARMRCAFELWALHRNRDRSRKVPHPSVRLSKPKMDGATLVKGVRGLTRAKDPIVDLRTSRRVPDSLESPVRD